MDDWYSNGFAQQSLVFEASSLPTKNVIVYCDRAEVKKVINTHLAKGTNEIIIENVSAVIERQSVRVDGRGAIIQEVQYQEMPIDTENETEKVRGLEREKVDIETERFSIEDDISSLRKRIEVLDGVAGQIATGSSANSSSISNSNNSINGSTGSQPNLLRRHTIIGANNNLHQPPPVSSNSMGFLINDDALNNLAKFLNYYGETTSEMKATLRRKQRESDSLTEKIEVLERQIDQLRCGYEYDSLRRNISIVVEMENAGTIELFVSYQVYCASWKPCYDIRAATATPDGEISSQIKLCYYGLIEQNTGDDWRDCELVLSTSAPSVGGCPPALHTIQATLHKPNRIYRRSVYSRRKPLSATSEEDMGFGSFDYNEMTDAAALYRGHMSKSSEDTASTPSVENLVSTCFSVPRAVSIPSNGVEHKVLISMIDVPCVFSNETVPSKCAAAFLSATVTNNLAHPLLPGAASVYLNNNFVTKTHIRLISPGEEFKCSLGLDPSIKVEYKTPVTYCEQVGFVSKSTLMTHEQTISIRNAKATSSCQITVKEQIPKSSDERIKVIVVHPELKSKSSDARMNKEHNLEWSVTLAAGQQRDLLVKYTVEHPSSELLTLKVQ